MPLGERLFMKAHALVKVINKINDSIAVAFEKEIQAIIQETLNESNNIRIVKQESDLTRFQTVGFYMIFNNDSTVSNSCNCTVTHNHQLFTCVYRGHAYHIKDRLKSHLFYTAKSPYKSCMLVEYAGKKYNINIFTQECFQKGIKKNVSLPQCDWVVVKITLSHSKQATREMFETAFDNIYGKPITLFIWLG